MEEKFDADFNKEIRKTINTFNQKVKRAAKRGEGRLPAQRSVREFKEQFPTKYEASQELNKLRAITNKNALGRHRTKEGTITNWEYDYIIDNLKSTDKWINRELEKAKRRYKDYPDHLYAIREDVNRLMDEKAIINRNLSELNARELKTVSATIDRYKKRNVKMSSGRRYFMKNLDSLLTAKGMSRKEREALYKKLNALTPEQFGELYTRHDIISDIMLIIPSPDSVDDDGRSKLAEDAMNDEMVQATMNTFLQEIDSYIEEAKKAVSSPNLNKPVVDSEDEYQQYLNLFKR